MATTIDSIYWDSVLSHAAYGDESPPIKFTDSAAAALESSALATAFTNRFDVLDISTTSSPTDTGFAAMVAKDKTTGKVTIAFRGTEPSISDYSTDALAIASGVAAGQIVDMYNYLLRVFAPEGEVVNQYVYDVGDGALRVEDTATGLGLVTTGTTVDFTGHSLGGHLALAASRMFENKTDQVYTYNALGFRGGSDNSFLNAFPGAVTSFPVGRIHDITAEGYPKGASSRSLFPFPSGCDSLTVPIERAGLISSTGGHSIDNLEETLSVYNLLSSLDLTLTKEQMRSIILSATYSADGKLEATVDALRAAVKGGAVTPTPLGRESLLSTISNDMLLKSVPSSGVSIVPLANMTSIQIARSASQDASVFLAVQRLSPIALRGYTPPIGSDDDAALTQWQQDRSGTLEGQNYTSEYLTDKAKMLSGILTLAVNDKRPDTDAASSTAYRDLATGKQLGSSLDPRFTPQVIFGTDASEMLAGSNKVLAGSLTLAA